MIKNRDKIISEAVKACKFDLKAINGGQALKHKPSSYGIALKYLVHKRGFTYDKFAKLYNGTTAQNLNYYINRCDKDRYFDENVEKFCKVLHISVEYFNTFCEEIEKIMEK